DQDAFPLDDGGVLDTDGDGVANASDDDDDGDGVTDSDDAFPLNSTESVDTDSDGIGNNADEDDDGDGVKDALDAFPLNKAEFQDTDGDGVGNNEDTDDDGDGIPDDQDAFPLDGEANLDTDGDGIANNNDDDDDSDGIVDALDAFPLDKDEFIDTDSDGIGNNTDTDDDGDGVNDDIDAFPLNKQESLDTDEDGIGNSADDDDDNDGIIDAEDAFPLDATEYKDTDLDGIGNNTDSDDDGDGVSDDVDAFPLDANESIDTDGDTIGNNTDSDDDGDGISDADENFYSLDPLSKEDGQQDSDGDGVSNVQEIYEGSDPTKDDHAPIFTELPVIELQAKGVFTKLTPVAITAIDAKDGEIEAYLPETSLKAGRHVVTWSASDDAGNLAMAEQVVIIHPYLSVAKSLREGEGNTIQIPITLSGPAQQYPVEIPLIYVGTAENDVDYFAPETVQIVEGTTATVSIEVLSDNIVEDGEYFQVIMRDPDGENEGVGLGQDKLSTVYIVDSGAPPSLQLSISQDGVKTRAFSRLSGEINAKIIIDDPNGDHTVAWTSDSQSIVFEGATDNENVAIDPASMAIGQHRLNVNVTDSELPGDT
ncbi:MAG TPA: thrombospondin type 3 repeat-containing protein, partial [Pseudomonadales bacterium]|nr:thrombospondin type 3 repeat-containing protein [Pseudomonadales bacterium]